MLGRLPSQVAWRHVGAREGFEVTFVAEDNGVLCFTGTTSALEDGHAWTISYQVIVDRRPGRLGAHVSAPVQTPGSVRWR